MKKPDSLRRYRANLQGEVDGAVVYRALAESESDPKLAEVFRRLTSGEEAHGEFWRGRMGAKGDKLLLGPSLRARILAWLAHRFGPGLVIPTLAAAESRDSAVYDDQADASSAGL